MPRKTNVDQSINAHISPKALKESEVFYKHLANLSPEAVVVHSEGKVMYANPAAKKLFLFKSDKEFIGKPVMSFVHPDTVPLIKQRIERMLRKRKIAPFVEEKFINAKGEVIVAETKAVPFVFQGKPAILAILHDISARKKAEERQKHLTMISDTLGSSIDYKTTLHNIFHILVPALADYIRIVLLDEDRNTTEVVAYHKDPQKLQKVKDLYQSYKGKAHVSYGVDRLLASGKSEILERVTPEIIAQYKQYEKAIASLNLISYMGVPLKIHGRIIGALTFSSTSPERIYSKDDLRFAEEIARRIAFAIENARLYQRAQQTIATESRLAAIVASSDDGIVSKDLDGIIMSWNKGAEKIFGYSAEEIIGKSIRTIIPPELQQEEDTILSRIRQGKKIDHFQTTRVRKDGRRVDVSITVSPIRDHSGKVVGASKIARDITEEKRMQRQKDDFLSMASHELKTPITSMKIFIDLLGNELMNMQHEKSSYYLKRIHDQSNRLSELTNDLLDVSRIQTGKLSLNIEVFMLAELVEDTVEGLQGSTRKHVLRLKKKKGLTVAADRYRIYQVLVNLITNAVKYSPKGGDIIITVTKKGDKAVVSVQDFGIGIKKEQQEKIFDKLYQVTDPEEKTYPGLGLGLYISKDIIERHNGRIWVESTKGKGSTFSFAIPIAQT